MTVLDEKPGPEAEGQCQVRGTEPCDVHRIERGRIVLFAGYLDRLADAQRRRRAGPAAHQLGDVVALVGDQIEGGQISVGLSRRDDAALMSAKEGLDRSGGRAFLRRLERQSRSGQARPRGESGAAEKAASRRARVVLIAGRHGVAFASMFTSSST